MSVIPLFRRLRVYYLEAGLLEALWKVLKIVPENKLGLVETGIRAIRATYQVLAPPPRAFVEAIRLYRNGHRDYIDDLYYATALLTETPFLTIDYSFMEFLRGRGYPVEGVVVTPEELRSYTKSCRG